MRPVNDEPSMIVTKGTETRENFKENTRLNLRAEFLAFDDNDGDDGERQETMGKETPDGYK